MALYEYLRSNIHINEPTLRANFIEGLFRGLLEDPVGFLNSMPEEDEILVRRCLNDLCFEAVANPALADIGKQVKGAFRSLPPRRWRSLTKTLSVTFRLPDGSVELGPSTGHTLTLHPMTRQVVWTRPRTKGWESYYHGERGCVGCSSCTTHKRPPRGTKTEVFHINHFYNHVVEHYSHLSWPPMRHYVSPSALKAKYKTDSLEEISKCFYVEGGASLFEVLGYPPAAPSESVPSESALFEFAFSESAPSVVVPPVAPSESVPSVVVPPVVVPPVVVPTVVVPPVVVPPEPAPSESVPPVVVPPVVVPSAPGRFPSPPEVELEALLQQAQTLFEEAQLAEDRVEEANKVLEAVNATQEDVKRAADAASAIRDIRTGVRCLAWEHSADEAVVSSQAALAKVEAEVRAAQTEAHEARKYRILAWNDFVSVGMTMTNTAIMLRIRP